MLIITVKLFVFNVPIFIEMFLLLFMTLGCVELGFIANLNFGRNNYWKAEFIKKKVDMSKVELL